ncbi:putative nuclease HARBI1 [Anastrepha obliqua]|uniref:putative nuclease HARBI1 n=1 Tax=Anastrepha obliqua TaxID=95512 RepID=UPI002409EE74|nr:putative nuclease HARBI1 [Anastrepha obliqua]
MYYNYKKFFSIVLMAVCDAKYTSTANLMQNTLPLPPPARISMESPQPLPHLFVGDAAFPLRTNLRTKRIFNYRLSRARRVIENSFGILTARWRILRTTIEYDPKNCEKVVLACIVLHNFIILNYHNRWYCPENYVDRQEPGNIVHCGEW